MKATLHRNVCGAPQLLVILVNPLTDASKFVVQDLDLGF